MPRSPERNVAHFNEPYWRAVKEKKDPGTLLNYGCRIDIVNKIGLIIRPNCGYLRYLGPTEFAAGVWAGIELDSCTGKHDGAVNGKRYFRCLPNKGLFLKESCIKRSARDAPAAEPNLSFHGMLFRRLSPARPSDTAINPPMLLNAQHRQRVLPQEPALAITAGRQKSSPSTSPQENKIFQKQVPHTISKSCTPARPENRTAKNQFNATDISLDRTLEHMLERIIAKKSPGGATSISTAPSNPRACSKSKARKVETKDSPTQTTICPIETKSSPAQTNTELKPSLLQDTELIHGLEVVTEFLKAIAAASQVTGQSLSSLPFSSNASEVLTQLSFPANTSMEFANTPPNSPPSQAGLVHSPSSVEVAIQTPDNGPAERDFK